MPASTRVKEHIIAVRLWWDVEHAAWRAALQEAEGSSRYVFADLNELTTFLKELTARSCASSPDEAYLQEAKNESDRSLD